MILQPGIATGQPFLLSPVQTVVLRSSLVGRNAVTGKLNKRAKNLSRFCKLSVLVLHSLKGLNDVTPVI